MVNFEGGCYAKVIRLSHEGEPEIYSALRHDFGKRGNQRPRAESISMIVRRLKTRVTKVAKRVIGIPIFD